MMLLQETGVKLKRGIYIVCKNQRALLKSLYDVSIMIYYMNQSKKSLQNENQILTYENRRRKL